MSDLDTVETIEVVQNKARPPREQHPPGPSLTMPALDDSSAASTAVVTKAARGTEHHQSSPQPRVERRRVTRTATAHLFVTLCHWSMVLLLALSLLSGMRIGWGYMESQLGGMKGVWGGILGSMAPAGSMLGVNLILLHVLLAFAMLLITGVYVGYLFRSHTTARLQVSKQDLRKLLTGIRTRNFWRNKPALWSANVLTYWLSFVFLFILTVTGFALYRLDWGLSTALGGYNLVRLVHGVVAYLLIPYVFLHMVLQWFFGRFWTIFKAQLYQRHVWAGMVSAALTLPIAASLYIGDQLPSTLKVKRIAGGTPPPVLDGDSRDPAWTQAESVTIRTAKGTNSPEPVEVTVKALHDGQYVYFQFQWADPDASYKRFPLLKTAQGWKVLQTAYEQADETVYYEDKLSMYITDVTNGSCADTCHIGSGPYGARGDKHGLHYTTHSEIGDVWHWKSVRTNPMGDVLGEPGFMDDQHFRPMDPVPVDINKDRYTGGYYPDPQPGGGYSYNFVKLDPKKPLGETYVRPKILPPTNNIRPNPDPKTSEENATWWIHKSQGIPYTPEADTYPVGTLIPNIIVEPLQGDRADVRAKGVWRQGRWTLETRRVLDTQSQFDVAFIPGKPLYITVALYNRVQTRHTEHIRPIQVILQP